MKCKVTIINCIIINIFVFIFTAIGTKIFMDIKYNNESNNIKQYENIVILKKGNSIENNNIIDWVLIQDSVGSIRRVPCYDKMIFDWINEGDSIKNIQF